MKIADGLQYEVWVPTWSDKPFPKEFTYVGFDRDAAIAAVDLALMAHKPEDLMIVVGEGFEVYHITVEDLRNKE
jgi:hypothetical protein